MKSALHHSAFILAILLARPSSAQEDLGVELKGKIKSPANSAAIVILDDPKGKAAWHTTTAKDGSYTISLIPPGLYRLCVAVPHYDAIVKRVYVDSRAKPHTIRVNSDPKLYTAECPSLSKAFRTLTPAEKEKACISLTVSRGTWSGDEFGYGVKACADGRIFPTSRPLPPFASEKLPAQSRSPTHTELEALFNQIYSSGFFDLPSPPPVRMILDARMTTLSFVAGGLFKSVEHITGVVPPEVAELEDEIKSLTELYAPQPNAPEDETLLGGVGEDLHLPKKGMTPLLRAAGTADLDTFKRCIEEGQDPGAVDSSGWTALMIAASEGNDVVLEYLLAHGTDPNVKSRKGETALMAAVGGWSGSLFPAKALLTAGADPNAENDEGQTALIWAARRARPSAIQALLAAHANVNHRAKDGSTALALLRMDLGDRSLQCLEFLRAAGATK